MSNMHFTKSQTKAIKEDGKNILVSAGAGSGKTAVLTERIVEKLKKGVSLEELIILTFTNAAALEMKTRIQKKIEEEIKKGNKSLIKEKAKIENALICTFDSFALFLVKKYHYLLKLDPNIQIADTIVIEKYKREKLEEIINEKYEKKEKDFLTLIDTFTLKDDKKIKETILFFYQKLDTIVKKEDFLKNYFINYYQEENIENYLQKWEQILKEEYQNILLNIENMSFYITSDTENFYEKIKASFQKLPKEATYDDFLYLSTLKLPILRGKEDTLYKEEIKEIYENIKTSLKIIKESINYQDREEIKEEIKSTQKTVHVMIDILKKLDTKMWEIKKEKNIFTFSDITFLAIQLLEENSTIREEIKEKTKEIMIDEYQDTNDTNEYLISLIASHNLYMVGDVKQSIYGFRNANPSLFMEKYETYQKEENGIKIDLQENFRSHKEVLDAVNMIFEKIMDLEIGGADYKNGHQMIAGSIKEKEEEEIEHQLQVLTYQKEESEKRKEEIEAFIIGNDIKKKIQKKYTIYDKEENKQRPVRFSDFTILMDRKTDFDVYKKIFTNLNIPVLLNKEEKFIASDEMYVLKNILKLFILYKEKKYYDDVFIHPFLSVARSFLFSCKDQTILEAFQKAKEENITFYRAIKQIDDLNKICIKIQKIEEKKDTYSLSELLYEIYLTFDFYNKINTKENIHLLVSKLDYLLKVAENLEKIGYGIEEMVLYFEDALKYKNDVSFMVPQNKKEGVMITNIHKSKGLEYPICYYSGLYKTFSKEDYKDSFLFHKKYGFIVPIFKEGIKETILKTLLKKEYQKQDKAEKIRLFYVALTRAREKIILVTSIEEKEEIVKLVSSKTRLSYNSFDDILKSVSGSLVPYQTKVDITKIDMDHIEEKEKFLRKIPNTEKNIEFMDIQDTKIEKEKQEYASKIGMINEKEKEKMEKGILLHHYLERIDFKNVKRDFIKYNVPLFYQNIITKFLKAPFLENRTIRNIYKEYPFIEEKTNKKGIIDLLIETDDGFLIVDYKLKEIDKESYQKQVKGYMTYIESLTDKKVEGYLYSLLEGTYQEVAVYASTF